MGYTKGQAVEFKSTTAKKWFPAVVETYADNVYVVKRPSGQMVGNLGESMLREPLAKQREEILALKKPAKKRRTTKTTVVTKPGTSAAGALKAHDKKAVVKGPKGVVVGTGDFMDQAGTNSLSGQLHDDFQYAFNWFNERLFKGALEKPFWVTVRKRNVLAHYGPKRWASTTENKGNAATVVDEMGINPDYMVLRGPEDFLSSIVHEMCHQYQYNVGTPPRPGYHDQEFADLMEGLGLITSSTGKEGGKRKGQRMDHYIIDGLFRNVCKDLLDGGFAIRWAGAIEEFHGAGAVYVPGVFGIEDVGEKPKPAAKKATRAKFVCPHEECKESAMAKPSAALMCATHKEVMVVG